MNTFKNRYAGFIKSLGPGLLLAGTAIGGSHLVQSTRAGADYGFALVWVIIMANLLKYPFFEFGPRYNAATGKNLLHAYMNMGRWVMWLFVALTISTIFFIEAALLLITAGLAGQLLNIDLGITAWALIVGVACFAILRAGKYKLLDSLMKIIIVVLSVSTVTAALLLLSEPPAFAAPLPAPEIWNVAGIAFIVALVGWMPSPVDLSVWHSIWCEEKQKQSGYKPKMREALFDFNLGYVVTALLALAFVAVGARTMYGSPETFSNSGIQFSGQLVAMYTNVLGDWAWLLISLAASITMLSTVLAVTDAGPRVIAKSVAILYPDVEKKYGEQRMLSIIMLVMIAISLGIIAFYLSGIKSLLDLATTVSFLTTPVIAWLNYKAITSEDVSAEHRPPGWMMIFAWICMAFWTAFAGYYLYTIF